MTYKEIIGVLCMSIFLAFISSGFAGATLAFVTFAYQGFISWLNTHKQQKDIEAERRLRKLEDLADALKLDVR